MTFHFSEDTELASMEFEYIDSLRCYWREFDLGCPRFRWLDNKPLHYVQIKLRHGTFLENGPQWYLYSVISRTDLHTYHRMVG
jgi:hypothetical protein